MPNVRIDIEYDGSNFCGWQIQPGQRSVQGALHEALEIILREKIALVRSSGRTDAGVHARCQTCDFKISGSPDLNKLIVGVGHLLRGEISVLRAQYVPDEFNARHSLVKKQYRYVILNRSAAATIDEGYVWHVPQKLNVELMQQQAQQFLGKHDYSSFRAVGCVSKKIVKEIFSAEVVRDGDYVVFTVIGRSFLKQMVRNMIGTLVDLSLGKKLPHGQISEILKARNRCVAGQTAPPQGLFLDWIEYLS